MSGDTVEQSNVPPRGGGNDYKSSIENVYSDIVRRYEGELAAKEVLESKAVSFLGFVGVFLAVLTSVSTVQLQGSSLVQQNLEETFTIIGVPLLFQVAASILLFFIIWGHSVHLGADIKAVFRNRFMPSEWVMQGLMAGYCESILLNRIFLMRRVMYFRLSVMCVAISIGQLTLSVAAKSLDLGWEFGDAVETSVFGVPAVATGFLGYMWIAREHGRMSANLADDLRLWRKMKLEEGGIENG